MVELYTQTNTHVHTCRNIQEDVKENMNPLVELEKQIRNYRRKFRRIRKQYKTANWSTEKIKKLTCGTMSSRLALMISDPLGLMLSTPLSSSVALASWFDFSVPQILQFTNRENHNTWIKVFSWELHMWIYVDIS